MPDITETVDLSKPVVWTELGNVNCELLGYSTRWEFTPDYIKLVEIYTLDGRVIRESAHIKALTGLSMTGQMAT